MIELKLAEFTPGQLAALLGHIDVREFARVESINTALDKLSRCQGFTPEMKRVLDDLLAWMAELNSASCEEIERIAEGKVASVH